MPAKVQGVWREVPGWSAGRCEGRGARMVCGPRCRGCGGRWRSFGSRHPGTDFQPIEIVSFKKQYDSVPPNTTNICVKRSLLLLVIPCYTSPYRRGIWWNEFNAWRSVRKRVMDKPHHYHSHQATAGQSLLKIINTKKFV